jgi:hypothetical protein
MALPSCVAIIVEASSSSGREGACGDQLMSWLAASLPTTLGAIGGRDLAAVDAVKPLLARSKPTTLRGDWQLAGRGADVIDRAGQSSDELNQPRDCS